MQKTKEYINLEINNLLSLFVAPKININSTYLTYKEQLVLNSIANEIRKQEFLQVRELRNKTIGKLEIHYKDDGKPFLADSNDFISISHSQNFIGILKAPFDVGLDIEEINERITKIKNRFLNEDELVIFGTAIEDLTKAWTIKEALFKLNNRKGIDFRKELIIEEKTGIGFNCRMLDKDGWRTVKIKTLQKGNLIISYNFEPSTLL
jgi:phosphopantetheinyl transferase (holo-ACP synthase)